jgi:hypothetical protein
MLVQDQLHLPCREEYQQESGDTDGSCIGKVNQGAILFVRELLKLL